MRIGVDEILLRTEAIVTTHPAPHEPCARCGQYHRLTRVGRLWMQPEHECRVIEEEAVS
jgi:hypothetical protein